MLTALTIHLFKVESFSVAFLRDVQRALCPKRFLCYLALFFSYLESFFVVFYLFLYFYLALRISTAQHGTRRARNPAGEARATGWRTQAGAPHH